MRNATPRKKTRLREKQRRARIIKISLTGVLLVAIVVSLSLLSRSGWARVQSVTVRGNSLVPAEELRKVAEEAGAAALLGVFNRDNILLYPKQKVQQNITDRFKTIQYVDVSFESSKNIEIRVVEREPAYVWCEKVSSSQDDCFFMDETGYIFSATPNFSGNVFFTYYGLLDAESPVGKTFLSADRLKALKVFSESVRTLGATPVGLITHTEDDYELLLSPSGRILFNNKIEFLKTFENLDAIMKEYEKAGSKDFFARLDYIDLRFGFKAFYKLR